MATFIIVGATEPLYAVDLSNSAEDAEVANQLELHSSLDLVDDFAKTNTTTYVSKPVDRFQDKIVSAYITPGNVKFLLLHRPRSEDSVKAFFLEVHELYLKVLMNPFYKPNSKIDAKGFDAFVRHAAQRLLS